MTEQALKLLLLLAHGVAASPLASLLTPTVPGLLFGLMIGGLLWCLLWRSGLRWLGLGPVAVGVAGVLILSPPDILVTGDGRHVAVRTAGGMAILRERAGDYVRDTLSEGAGYDGALSAMTALPQARCSADLCALKLAAGNRVWHLLVTRSPMLVDRAQFAPSCATADIVISDRALPRWCRPRWIRIDRRLLARTGGVAIDLDQGTLSTVRDSRDAHPWITRPTQRPAGATRPQLYRRSSPASLP